MSKAEKALELLKQLVNDEIYSEVIAGIKSKDPYFDPDAVCNCHDAGNYFVCELLLEMDEIVNG